MQLLPYLHIPQQAGVDRAAYGRMYDRVTGRHNVRSHSVQFRRPTAVITALSIHTAACMRDQNITYCINTTLKVIYNALPVDVAYIDAKLSSVH